MASTAARNKKSNPTNRKVKRLPEVGSVTPKWIRIADFARHFAMSVSGVHKAIEAGAIKTIPVPGTGEKEQRRIPYSEVVRIESGK